MHGSRKLETGAMAWWDRCTRLTEIDLNRRETCWIQNNGRLGGIDHEINKVADYRWLMICVVDVGQARTGAGLD